MVPFSDYLLGETLYEDSEVHICRAIHQPSKQHVVIKHPATSTPSLRMVGRLIHEYQVLKKLDQIPGVERAEALLRQSDTAMLVLKDEGLRSLERVLAARGRLRVGEVLQVAVQLCNVLQELHAAGIIHKDLKPLNILLDANCNRIALTGFGIASELTQETAPASIPEALEGTLAYISPEQTGRTARTVDVRTDLYSLGVTMFEMLTGQRPFDERDPLALVYSHLARPAPLACRLVPDIPPTLSAIVAKLLAKEPERRYQTAQGAAYDLEQARLHWAAGGRVEDFVLGQKDHSPQLRLPQLLVGREQSIRELADAYTSAAQNAVELVLVGGPSGIGKTALVRTVYVDIARAGRGLLIAGKHDQLARSRPYAAMAEAFGGLIRQWLASPPAILDGWKERIRKEVGDNARLIADAVPELTLVMGPLAAVPQVHGEQILNRLKLTWLNFIRAVTAASPPLVMFLDDMQWADSGTLTILQTLLTDVERSSLLVIAAYRDDEVPPEHPLWKLVEAVADSSATIRRQTIGPLSEAEIQIWLGWTLSRDPSEVVHLASILGHKTHGNPFFLELLLLALHRQRYIVRNTVSGQWTWDIGAIEKAAATDNVVTLLTAKVSELPEATQRLLGLAACAGHQFWLSDLGRLSGLTPGQLGTALRPALHASLVVPLDVAYRPAQALLDVDGSWLDAAYRFLHDRVQQSSYERISIEQRTAAHLEIGRRLYDAYRAEGGSTQSLLEMVRHLNLGAPQIVSEAERADLARLNLEAARRAKSASAYVLMVQLIETSQGLLGEAAWQISPGLMIELALERLEAAYLLRDFDDVEARAQALLALPLPALPRLAVQEVRVRSCVAAGHYARGLQLGLQALEETGRTYPATEAECEALLAEEAVRLDQWFIDNPDGFERMELDSSLQHLIVDALQMQTMICAGFGNCPMLFGLSTVRSTSEICRRGALTHAAPLLIAGCASVWSMLTGMYRRAAAWVAPVLRAQSRLSSPFLSECLYYKGTLAFYSESAEQAFQAYEQATAEGLKSGSSQGTSWALAASLNYCFAWRGRPLPSVHAYWERNWPIIQRVRDAVGRHGFELSASFCDTLQSPAGGLKFLSAGQLSPGSQTLAAGGFSIAAEGARIFEAQIFLALDEYEQALTRACEAEKFRTMILANAPVTDIPLWLGLAAAKCSRPDLALEKQDELRGYLRHALIRFRYFAEGCEENFLHKLRLLEAEQARLEGDFPVAMAKYDEAISLARKTGFLHIEALAAQLCAQFYLQARRERIAALYLREARDAYLRWGALALSSHLETRFSKLMSSSATDHTDRAATAAVTTAMLGSLQLDVATVVRAAQTLSSELDSHRVVGRLMDLVLENAGAQRGALILKEKEVFSVVARLTGVGSRIETGFAEPLEQSSDVSAAVVQYVARTREPLLINDTWRDKRIDDAYVAARAIRALLALPLTHQGRLVGVLCLEHCEAPSAFPPARVALLAVLASQAAIAVENALLYRDVQEQVRALQAQNQEILQLNQELRRQIEQRSKHLVEALLSKDLSSTGAPRLSKDSMLGNCYRVIRIIGEGGMGVVYEVERTTDRRRLAAKVLNSRPDRDALGRFAREAQILAQLNHPNLISIFDMDVTVEGSLYIAMELVNGSSLWQQKARFGDVEWGLCILRQVAEALAVLHEKRIVHRDLKPENILLEAAARDDRPVVKLADFGISIVLDESRRRMAPMPSPSPEGREQGFAVTLDGSAYRPTVGEEKTPAAPALVESVSDMPDGSGAPFPVKEAGARTPLLTQTGMIIGTPLYMAPELLHGSRNAQPPSDIFSLGVIAFEVLTGSMPFAGPSVLSVVAGEKLATPSRLRRCAGLGLSVAKLLEACLSPDPTERPTAQQVAQSLAKTDTKGSVS